MDVVITRRAEKDLSRLPIEVEDTLMSKKEAAEKNMGLGADPGQTFDKYLSGNMHPLLQMNLGRDYRAWFIEDRHMEDGEGLRIYAVRVLSKKEAEKLSNRITDARAFARSFL